MSTTSDRSIPRELAVALADAPRVQAIWRAMPPSHRSEYARWIAQAKKRSTRQARSARAVHMIRDWGARRSGALIGKKRSGPRF